MPPTFKEGARRIITTDRIKEIGLTPGCKGVVIVLDDRQLWRKMHDYKIAIEGFDYWHNKLKYPFGYGFTMLPDLTRVYDYFTYYTTPEGKIQLSGYHSHISREHFEYIDDMIEEKAGKQLCFDFT